MIEILTGNDFIKDSSVQDEMTKIIKFKLEQAKKDKTFIITSGIRNIGKTYSLMEYARENGYYVVVSTNNIANILKEKYPKNEIIYSNIRQDKNIIAVCDENVDIDLCKNNNINIVTGYINNYKINENSELNFGYDILQTLKKEIICLNSKIEKARNNNDFGTYKNLILAYKEVLGLYKEMIEEKKDRMTICNMTNTFKIDKDGGIEIIADKVIEKINEQFKKTGTGMITR